MFIATFSIHIFLSWSGTLINRVTMRCVNRDIECHLGYLGHPFCPVVAEGLRALICPGSSLPASHRSVQLGHLEWYNVALFRHLIHIIQNYYRTIIKHYIILNNHQKAFKPCSEESFLDFLPVFSCSEHSCNFRELQSTGTTSAWSEPRDLWPRSSLSHFPCVPKHSISHSLHDENFLSNILL